LQSKPKNKKRLSILLLVLCVTAFVVLAFQLIRKYLPGLIPVFESGDETAIENYIRGMGSFQSVMITGMLQFIQIISIILPGWAIQIPAGIIFGAFYGYLICQTAYALANFAVFLFARKLGSRINDLVPGGKKLIKVRVLEDAEFPELTVFFACMMPGVPNGIVPYIAARTKITTKNFLISMLAGSFPNILMQCAIGNRIMNSDYLFAGILLAAVLGLMCVTYLFRKKLIAFAHRMEEKRNAKKAEKNSFPGK